MSLSEELKNQFVKAMQNLDNDALINKIVKEVINDSEVMIADYDKENEHAGKFHVSVLSGADNFMTVHKLPLEQVLDEAVDILGEGKGLPVSAGILRSILKKTCKQLKEIEDNKSTSHAK